MPDNTNTNSKQGTGWLDLVNAALAIYGATREGQTPNTYPVPLTRTEQDTADAKRSLFDYSSAFTDQYLRGFNNLQPDYKLNTNAVGNPEFMGGVKIPQIDWSRMPARPSYGTPSGATTKPGGLTGEGSGPTGVPGDPFGSITSPAGSPRDPFANFPAQTGPNTTWDDIKALGPQAIQIAQILLGQGLPLATVIDFVLSKFGKQTLPPGKDFSDIDTTPAGVTHPPRRTPQDPGFAAGAADRFNRGQNDRLGSDPGQFAPDRLGGGKGFGYGLDYDTLLGGGRHKP